ncbi:UDP-N-acetyl glucosamine 2-epimerase [Mucilaginibacter frigoritolerans]|nr:UDP-N-acetyl glucosamine 2-epimerase [Mucilaginibacter frigoritolerans]
MDKKILFITGSMNQTIQMHLISQQLKEFDCWFSQLFTDSPFINKLIKHTPLLNNTILAGQFKINSEKYLESHGLQIDYQAKKNKYDLVVYCSDLHIPKRMQQVKTIWVQEGMTDKYTLLSTIVRSLKLPPILSGGTSLNGSSNICDVYCAGSDGYKKQFIKLGTDANKIKITGIPNYDNIKQFLKNDFPYKDYVMVATTDMRETFRYENRPAFIKKAVKLAAGRKLLFKLHPNEKFERAEAEIKKYAPAGTLIYRTGNTNHMIANCSELITQYSTVVYVGLALGKKVHSYFDINDLKRLAPLQNNGKSALRIANICRDLMGVYAKEGYMHNYMELEKRA